MILLPTLDEEEGLADVLPRLPVREMSELGWESKVLIIDGGSKDLTTQVAQESGCELLQQQGKGKGAAMRLGFLHFLQADYDALVMLDPDGTYHPEEIPKFLKKLEHADVVIGDRLRGAMDPDAMTRTNYFGNHVLTWIAVALYGVPMNDLCSGYWGFSKQAPQVIVWSLRSAGPPRGPPNDQETIGFVSQTAIRAPIHGRLWKPPCMVK